MKSVLLRAALVGALLTPFAANATPISGSDSVALFNVTVTPSGAPLFPISGVSSINYTFGLTTSVGTGNFSIIPVGSPVTPSILYPMGPNGGNGTTPFSVTIAGFGTFTETGNPIVLANTSTGRSTGVEFYLLGIFQPSGALSAYSSNDAAFDVSFTQTGGSYSGSGTFAVPSATPTTPMTPTPEPSSIALLGTAVLAGAGFMKKKLFA